MPTAAVPVRARAALALSLQAPDRHTHTYTHTHTHADTHTHMYMSLYVSVVAVEVRVCCVCVCVRACARAHTHTHIEVIAVIKEDPPGVSCAQLYNEHPARFSRYRGRGAARQTAGKISENSVPGYIDYTPPRSEGLLRIFACWSSSFGSNVPFSS